MNTIVDLYESGKNKSILINLDISNTFMATNFNKLALLENLSSNQIIIENNKINV